MTQARPDEVKPRSLWIAGSATFTTVASSTIISMPMHSTMSAIQRERSFCVPAVAPWVSSAVGVIGEPSISENLVTSTDSREHINSSVNG